MTWDTGRVIGTAKEEVMSSKTGLAWTMIRTNGSENHVHMNCGEGLSRTWRKMAELGNGMMPMSMSVWHVVCRQIAVDWEHM